MINYLSNTELNAILSNATFDEAKTLYFQDSASHPAFLYLSSDDRVSMPSSESITAIFTTMQKVLKLVLPGAVFSASPFIPINNRLGTSDIAKYTQGFNETTISLVFGNVSYSLFDDASSDFFVIARSELTLAELNDTYGGSFRLAPVNVLKVLKQIGMLMGRITTSNTAVISPIEDAANIQPTIIDRPDDVIYDGDDVWSVEKIASNVVSIRLDSATQPILTEFNSTTYSNRLKGILQVKYPGKTFTLSNCRVLNVPGVSWFVFWDVVQN